MTIAIASPVRTGNPGVVPAPIAGGASPSGPVPAAPAPQPADDTTAGVAALGRDAITFIPVPGGIIVADLPDGGGFGVPGRPAPTHDRTRSGFGSVRQPAQSSLAREQQLLEDTVADVQAKFAQLGIREDEGNGPVVARFNPRYPNASYTPTGDPQHGIPADSITVGMDPRSNTSFARAEDVVAHELGHRVIDRMTAATGGELDMSPLSEDVAVHESLADTFAALVDRDDWVIGDQLVEPVRIMNDPERLGHPDNVDDMPRILAPNSPFMHTVGIDRRTGREVQAPDWHVVAGIPNKAASIIGDELGRDKLGEIYIKAVRENVRPGREIEGLAEAVLKSASDLYGPRSHEYQVTRDAWDAVGVLDLIREPVTRAGR